MADKAYGVFSFKLELFLYIPSLYSIPKLF